MQFKNYSGLNKSLSMTGVYRQFARSISYF